MVWLTADQGTMLLSRLEGVRQGFFPESFTPETPLDDSYMRGAEAALILVTRVVRGLTLPSDVAADESPIVAPDTAPISEIPM